jgi:hypothetical protein
MLNREKIIHREKNNPVNKVLNQLGKEEFLLINITNFSIASNTRIITPIWRIVPSL